MAAIDKVRKALEEAQARQAEAHRVKAAHALGFDDIEMFDLWSELEKLRSATLAAREAESSAAPPRTKFSQFAPAA